MPTGSYPLLVLLAWSEVILGASPRTAAQATTTLVSVNPDGSSGDDHSLRPAVSPCGRYVAFHSAADDLIPGVTSPSISSGHVFLRDLRTQHTELVSKSSAGEPGNHDSAHAVVSWNGRFVAFASAASNLVPGDTNFAYDIFVRDRALGTTERVNLSSSGIQTSTYHSFDPAISDDGRYVAFDSSASNLIPGDANGPVWDVFLHDRQTKTTQLVSVGSAGVQGNSTSAHPSLSANGRWLAFYSWSNNLVPGDTNNSADVFVRDLWRNETTVVSISTGGEQGNGYSYRPSISATGRHVAFRSLADNLVPGDTNGSLDIFVHDRVTGETTRVSVSSTGVQGNADSGLIFDDAPNPWISPSGRHVAFWSDATNLVSGDLNGKRDVFVHDRVTLETTRLSLGVEGSEADQDSLSPSISGRGRVVVYESSATNLVPSQDANGNTDVFAVSLDLAATALRR